MPRLSFCAVISCLGWALTAAPAATLIEWRPGQDVNHDGWSLNGDITEVQEVGGTLRGFCQGGDPILGSPQFEIVARPSQRVEIDLVCDKAGRGELFYSGTNEGEYGGFSAARSVPFDIPGDGQPHTLVVRPFWQAEKRIIKLRLDLARDQRFELSRIAVVDSDASQTPLTTAQFGDLASWDDDGDGRRWSPGLSLAADDYGYATLRLRAATKPWATFYWASDQFPQLRSLPIRLRDDGQVHTYNLPLEDESWAGQIVAAALDAGGGVVESLSLAADPDGPADLEVVHLGATNALQRAGRPAEVMARLVNHGGQPAAVGGAAVTSTPALAITPGQWPEQVRFGEPVTLTWQVEGERAGVYDLKLALPGTQGASGSLALWPALVNQPQGAMPPPERAQTDYRIGSYYFPGWGRPAAWAPIDDVAPWRKPLLGWYNEANPEVVDWQIKWALEHGISYFLVDWYWDQGTQQLDHWLKAFAQSRYRGEFKWAIMWANHIPDASHTETDWQNLTRFWLDNYLKTPEYLQVDGQPAVFIWNPGGIRRGLGGSEQAAKMIAYSQQQAREAGLAGLRFVAMNIAAQEIDPAPLAAEGYWGETHYHGWYGAESTAADPRHFPFSHVVDVSPAGWDRREAAMKAAGMHYLPQADTGWDSRPWHGEGAMTIDGRTGEEFERLLREAKAWLDARGQKDLVLGPWNEWGEGSWLEPNTEHGFSLLDAIRRVFCEPGRHVDLSPVDVGVGPYDFANIRALSASSWDFEQAGESGGWGPAMGISDFAVQDGAMTFKSSGPDPALMIAHGGLRADSFPLLKVRLSVAPPATGPVGNLQLFWSRQGRAMTEGDSISLPMVADGQAHDYTFRLSEQAGWKGLIRGLRLDPGNQVGLSIRIDSIEFLPWVQ